MATNPYDLAAVRNAATKKLSVVDAMKRLIRELEAELQVRDNMGNEVLRILREATGKRDFHSEMEAAEYAAELIRAGGWRPIAESTDEDKYLTCGAWVNGQWNVARVMLSKPRAIALGYTHYLPEPEPPALEVPNERG